jgi:hypothetical protein
MIKYTIPTSRAARPSLLRFTIGFGGADTGLIGDGGN